MCSLCKKVEKLKEKALTDKNKKLDKAKKDYDKLISKINREYIFEKDRIFKKH